MVLIFGNLRNPVVIKLKKVFIIVIIIAISAGKIYLITNLIILIGIILLFSN